MTIARHSSRRNSLADVLTERLSKAKRYLRIAGYFRSSLLEIVGEELGEVDEIRVVCNGELDPNDVTVAKAAAEGSAAVAKALISRWQQDQTSLDVLLAKRVLILAPATLMRQWQTELQDMLGLPSAIWSTTRKQWLDGREIALSPKGVVAGVEKCPLRIGIVSTGLIVNGDDDGERGFLLKQRFGVVILDEAHKARAERTGPDGDRTGENRLMAFIEKLAATAETVIIGTATPIQLRAEELWDLVNMLGQGAPQVLGEPGSRSWGSDTSIRYLTGDTPLPTDPTDRWALLRNPMPPNAENRLFRSIRVGQGLPDGTIRGPRYDDLTRSARDEFRRSFAEVVQQCNPIVRRVRRSRAMLEERKLIKRIAVAVHPKPSDGLPSDLFEGQGLRMGFAFAEAYSAATDFCSTYARLRPASGFMKTILLRRLGSSVKAGLNTTRALLRDDQDAVEDEYEDDLFQETKTKIPLTPGERRCFGG
jgi:hypothetical protein